MQLPHRSGGLLRRFCIHSVSSPTKSVCSTRVDSRCVAFGTQSSSHYLSAEDALQAAASIRGDHNAAKGNAAGLTFTLPPLCTWGASCDAGVSSSRSTHHLSTLGGSIHRGNRSDRYTALWQPIESYVTHLHTAPQRGDEGRSQASRTSIEDLSTSPPVCVCLRLFPDLMVAQLPARPHAAAQPHPSRRPVAPHEQPLEAILGADDLWGSGADPQSVFRHALDGLCEIGDQMLPRLPLVLQLPTRLLVSQQFLEDLATLLVRRGWRSVSFELPSTHQLFGGVGAQTLSRTVGGNGVDASWCRLPLLCTPWPALCRHPALGKTLRQLRRHDVVPFHVLLTWALMEAQLFQSLERSVVVDTMAPQAGSEQLQALWQSPQSVGCTPEETHRFATGTASDNNDDEHQRALPKERRVYMNENPMTASSVGVGLSSGVTDAVRRHQGRSADESLGAAECALRRQRAARAPTSASSSTHQEKSVLFPRMENNGSADSDATMPLILDAPPDHLRVLIERSIQQHDPGSSSLTPRQQLLQKVGRFMQHALQSSAAEKEDGGAAHHADTSAAQDGSHSSVSDADAALAREADELERLLAQANTGADVEDMMLEMQRYEAQQVTLRDSKTVSTSSDGTPMQQVSGGARAQSLEQIHNNVWLQSTGYWECLKALLSDVTHARLMWTLPTYNVDAVQAWTHALQSRALASPTAAAPSVIPVWMPEQSAMCIEVERLLREGRQHPTMPQREAMLPEEACRSWLPTPLCQALQEALVRLPREYQAQERRRLLRAYRLLREQGAQAARRGGTDIQYGSSAADSTPPEREEGEEGAAAVRLRIRHGELPFYLLSPLQAEAKAAAERETTTLAGVLRETDEALMSAIDAYYTEATRDSVATLPLSSLYVPASGLTVAQLRRSWQAV